jgi:succinate dehydrogenase/fumarate reductase-like Fe-S protein
MSEIVQAGHVRVISAMGNLPIHKDLVVDMEPFWAEVHAMKPWLSRATRSRREGKEYRVSHEP